MRIWSQATDVALLRKGVRLAIVGVVAAVLATQLLDIQTAAAHSHSVVTCPEECSVSFQACSGLTTTGYAVDRQQCQLADAIQAFQCVLGGAAFGPALRACQVRADRDEQICLQEAARDHIRSQAICNLQFSVCSLVCHFLGD